jgi:hypothetical protein
MSPQLAQILQQIDQLSSTEQAKILQHLTHPVKSPQSSTQTKHRASSFYGKAPNILQGVDAQTWVSSEREEWAEREISGLK